MMKETIIRKMCLDFINSEGYTAIKKKSEANKQLDNLYKVLIEELYKQNFNKATELESDIINTLTECEIFGFTQGFKHAVRLVSECMDT